MDAVEPAHPFLVETHPVYKAELEVLMEPYGVISSSKFP